MAGAGAYHNFERNGNEQEEYLNGTLCKKEYGNIPVIRELIAKKVAAIVIQPIDRNVRMRSDQSYFVQSAISSKETASSKWTSSETVYGGKMMLRMAEREGWNGRVDRDSCLYDGWKWQPVKIEPAR